jgi:hypothetical protein
MTVVVVTLVVVTRMIVIVIVTLVVVIVIVRLFLGGAGGRELTAGGHATTTGLGGGGTRAGAGPTGLRLARPEVAELRRRVAADDHRDVAGALADAARAAASTGPEALHRGALVGVARRHEELLGRDVVVVLRVGHGRVEALADDDGHGAVGELEHLAGLAVGQVADEVEHLAGLVCRHVRVLDRRTGAGTLVGLVAERHQRFAPRS